MEHLIFVCPTTRQEVDSGVESEIGTLLRIRASDHARPLPGLRPMARMAGTRRIPGKGRLTGSAA